MMITTETQAILDRVSAAIKANGHEDPIPRIVRESDHVAEVLFVVVLKHFWQIRDGVLFVSVKEHLEALPETRAPYCGDTLYTRPKWGDSNPNRTALWAPKGPGREFWGGFARWQIDELLPEGHAMCTEIGNVVAGKRPRALLTVAKHWVIPYAEDRLAAAIRRSKAFA